MQTMTINLGLPLLVVCIATPYQFFLAATRHEPGTVLTGQTLIPVSVGAIVLVAMARMIWWLSSRTRDVGNIEKELTDIRGDLKELKSEVRAMQRASDRLEILHCAQHSEDVKD